TFLAGDGSRYAYLIGKPAGSSSATASPLLYMYKLSSSNTVTPVVEGLALDPGRIFDNYGGLNAVMMNISGNVALMTFNNTGSNSSSSGLLTHPHIYLLSDLANNTKRDVYGG